MFGISSISKLSFNTVPRNRLQHNFLCSFSNSSVLSLLHLPGEGYKLNRENKPCCYLSLEAKRTVLNFRFTKEDFRNIASIEWVNSHSYILDHSLPLFVRQESSQEANIFPADTIAGSLPPQYLHKSQESVQNVNSQNKRFSCKTKKVGQTPKIFHLGIPLSRT